MLITLSEEHPPTEGYVRKLRSSSPRSFPASHFRSSPPTSCRRSSTSARLRQSTSRFRVPNLEANHAFASKMLARMRGVTGLADGRIQQAFQQPTLNVAFNRTMASLVGLNEQSAANSMLETLAGSAQTNPIYWLNPDNQISYPVSIQTPQFSMDNLGDLRGVPLTASGQSQLLGGLATFDPTASHAVISHYNIQPVIDILRDARRPRSGRSRQ